MKYNPKVNEDVARLPGFLEIHPFQPERTVQGALRLMKELEEYLAEISGMDAVTLQPAAGAHGELTSMMIVRRYHEKQGNPRKIVLIPDSAHGTNPASVTLAGYQAKTIKSNERGLVNIEELKKHLNEDVAAFMVTNPNTLGLFESEIVKISELVHSVGGLMYMDGANLNALLGYVRPGDIGFDVMHFNLHKTFSTPHGGGGPGSGPVGVKKHLEPFLPVPRIVEKDGKLALSYDFPDSIGKVHAFYVNFDVMVKAYTYIRMMGPDGLKRVAEAAVINANYLLALLKSAYKVAYDRFCMHEFVLTGRPFKKFGVRTLDIAKRLLRFGLPAGIEPFLTWFAFNVFVQIMHSFGPDTAAAATIAFNWDAVAFVPMLGLGVATTTIMGQHIGAPCQPVVGVGDEVQKGQLIGEARGYISANVHSPVSGKVRAVEPRVFNVTGRAATAVIIENDGEEKWADGWNEPQDAEGMDARQMVDQHYGSAASGGIYRGCASYNDFREIIERGDIDAVADVQVHGTRQKPLILVRWRRGAQRSRAAALAVAVAQSILGADARITVADTSGTVWLQAGRWQGPPPQPPKRPRWPWAVLAFVAIIAAAALVVTRHSSDPLARLAAASSPAARGALLMLQPAETRQRYAARWPVLWPTRRPGRAAREAIEEVLRDLART